MSSRFFYCESLHLMIQFSSLPGYIIKTRPSDYPLAPLPSMHFYTSLAASKPLALSGVTGRSRWSAFAVAYNKPFEVADIRMPRLIVISLNPPNFGKSQTCMTSHPFSPCAHLQNPFAGHFLTYNVCLLILLIRPFLRLSTDPSCILLPPRSATRPDGNLMAAIASALATRFDSSMRLVKSHLDKARIEEWGKVRRVDSDAGDTMCASSLGVSRDDARDATYVRVRYLLLCQSLSSLRIAVRNACRQVCPAAIPPPSIRAANILWSAAAHLRRLLSRSLQ